MSDSDELYKALRVGGDAGAGAVVGAEVLDELSKAMRSSAFSDALAKKLRARAAKVPVVKNNNRLSIPIIVSGKAGEVKTIAVKASNDEERPHVFRGDRLSATDTYESPGFGTRVLNVKIMGKRQIAPVTTRYLSDIFNRGSLFDTLHPRLSATFTILFEKDCEWRGVWEGRATEVKDEGVYAVAPTAPCDREMPAELVDPVKYAASFFSNGRNRCEFCWFLLSEHSKWPWREREFVVASDAIEPGKTLDLVVPAENFVVPHVVFVDSNEQREVFRTDGFGIAGKFTGSQREHGGDRFNYYLSHGLIVPRGDSFTLRVGNSSNERHAFAATIKAQALLAA